MNKHTNKNKKQKKQKKQTQSSQSKTKKNKHTSNINPSKKHVEHPAFVYHSEQVTYTSHPEKNTPFGKRTIVNIENGKGHKKLETLNHDGKVTKTTKIALNNNEMKEIKHGNYIPGLWFLGV